MYTDLQSELWTTAAHTLGSTHLSPASLNRLEERLHKMGIATFHDMRYTPQKLIIGNPYSVPSTNWAVP